MEGRGKYIISGCLHPLVQAVVALNSEDVYEGSVEGRIVQGGSPQGAQPPRL